MVKTVLKKVFIPVCCISLMVSFLSGCQMKKQAETSQIEAEGSKDTIYETVTVKNSKGDIDKIVQKFTGDTLEEAIKNGAEFEKSYGEDSIVYEKGVKFLSFSGKSKEGLGPVISYKDNYEMAGNQYYEVLSGITYSLTKNLFGTTIRNKLPGENIDGCTKEEALKYCNPYAELLGYSKDNSVAEVYALTLDSLLKGSETGVPHYGPLKGIDNKKPLPDDEFDKLQEKYLWTKEYEALYVVYKPYTNGLVFESSYGALEMIYAPAYEKIVYLFGEMPWIVNEKKKADKIITKEEAEKEAVTVTKAKKDNVKIENVTMVYSQNILHLRENNSLDLCYRVDLKIENSAMYTGPKAYQSVLINAVTGEECVMWPGLSD
ncbi:MAG: hypothetical protein K1W24_01480 [Lachnospiraceae bacterium]